MKRKSDSIQSSFQAANCSYALNFCFGMTSGNDAPDFSANA